uniref:Uncharacterized protein n=1 Tax=Anguilla anguilla TaxID=7936 RepID=A0A0E9XII5_ANGAN
MDVNIIMLNSILPHCRYFTQGILDNSNISIGRVCGAVVHLNLLPYCRCDDIVCFTELQSLLGLMWLNNNLTSRIIKLQLLIHIFLFYKYICILLVRNFTRVIVYTCKVSCELY